MTINLSKLEKELIEAKKQAKKQAKKPKNKRIEIPFSERDLQDLINGETFDWVFNDVEIHLFNEDLTN